MQYFVFLLKSDINAPFYCIALYCVVSVDSRHYAKHVVQVKIEDYSGEKEWKGCEKTRKQAEEEEEEEESLGTSGRKWSFNEELKGREL